MAVKLKSSVMSAGNLLMSQLFLQIAGPLVSILVVRYLGPEDYGHYASAMAVTAFIGILANFGTNQAALKYGSKSEQDLTRAYRICLAVSFFLALFAFFITLVWFLVIDYDMLTIQLGLIFCINYFVTAYMAPATAVLQTKGTYKKLALISICVSVSRWVVTIILLLLGANVRLVAGVPIVVSGAVSMTMFYIVSKSLLAKSEFNPKWGIREFLHDVWIFGLGGTFHQIYYQSDGALLSAMRSPLEVGFYNVPFRFLGIIYLIPGIIFNQVLYPKYFKLSSLDRDRYMRLYILTSKLMLTSGVLITLGLWAFGGMAIDIVFGKDFGPSTKYLILLAGAITVRYWASASGAILTTDNLAARKVRLQGEIALLNLVLNLVFIPIYGALAAAFITVVSETLLSLRYFQLTNKASLRINPWRELKLHYFLCILLLGGAVHTLPGWSSMHVIALISLTIILLTYIVVSSYFKEEEIAEVFTRAKC